MQIDADRVGQTAAEYVNGKTNFNKLSLPAPTTGTTSWLLRTPPLLLLLLL